LALLYALADREEMAIKHDSKRIVAATDFSSDAEKAVQRASMLASRLGFRLELLHVVSKSSLDAVREWVRSPPDVADRIVADAQHLLDGLAASIAGRTGLPVSAHVAVGAVSKEILSDCARAGMLVVGAHGLNALRDAILGSTAERLVGRYRGPLLVVRGPAQDEYRNVLAAIDLLAGSETVLAMAARIAPAARISAVHAYDVPMEGALHRAGVSQVEIDQHRARAFQKALDDTSALGERSVPDRHVLPIVERGDAARLIVDHQRSLGADLVVVGKRRRPAAEALVLGSVTRRVLAASSSDVLVLQSA
jgi:nucleotide-binding universal stress UspA family protein